MKYKLLILALASLLYTTACNTPEKKEKIEDFKKDYSKEYILLPYEKLMLLGIYIKDSSIMYNNLVDDVGSLNITIRDKGYYKDFANTQETNLKFYPRYITTLDTVQRVMYMLTGDQMQSIEEAKKWEKFESLVPIVVNQIEDGRQFGETLVFWFTKTRELEKLLEDFDKEK